jgi:hypothetical protein
MMIVNTTSSLTRPYHFSRALDLNVYDNDCNELVTAVRQPARPSRRSDDGAAPPYLPTAATAQRRRTPTAALDRGGARVDQRYATRGEGAGSANRDA